MEQVELIIERSKPTLKIDDFILKSPFSVQRIRKAVKKSPRSQQRKKKNQVKRTID